MTINKSQGQTLQNVGVWLNDPCFAHGQLYVCMSRVGSPKNLKFAIRHADSSKGFLTSNVVFKEVLVKGKFCISFIPIITVILLPVWWSRSPEFQVFPRGGARGGQAFCRFYNIFALLSTIYNKNLNKIYIYTKNFKSTIYNLKNVEWFSYFDPKLVTFRSYNCLFDHVIGSYINLKCINAQTHHNNMSWSTFALKSTIYNVLVKYFDLQIYNFLKLSVYNLQGLDA